MGVSVKYGDLLTQAEYARFINRTRARVSQMVKAKSLTTGYISGNRLIKLSKDEMKEYESYLKGLNK